MLGKRDCCAWVTCLRLQMREAYLREGLAVGRWSVRKGLELRAGLISSSSGATSFSLLRAEEL